MRGFHDLLQSEDVKPGDKLPPERVLASRFGVSRGVLRPLMEDLESLGVIRRASPYRRVLVDPSKIGVGREGADQAHARLDGVIALLGKRDDGARSSFDETLMTLPAHAEIEQQATREIIDRGRHVLNVAWRRLQSDGGQWLLKHRPAGIIAFRGADPHVLQLAANEGIPTVVFGELIAVPGVPQVASDHRAGAAELTRLAIESGKRRIVRVWSLIGSLDSARPWLDRRDCGYLESCKQSGVEPLPAIRIPNMWHGHTPGAVSHFRHNARTIAGYLHEYIRHHGPIDAVMATNDTAAAEIAEACRSVLGLDPINDVAIYGYDNIFRHSQPGNTHFTPALTVDKRNDLIGQKLSDVVLDPPQTSARDASDTSLIHYVTPLVINPNEKPRCSGDTGLMPASRA